MNKKLKKIADKILEIELKAQNNPDVDYSKLLEPLISQLSFKDMIELDIYLQEKLLTK